MSQFTSRVAFVAMAIIVALALLACDVGSLLSQKQAPGNASQDQPTAAANNSADQPTAVSKPGKTQVPSQSTDAASRIGDSLNRVLLMDKKVLDSYHLEASGNEPGWNKTTKKVESQPFTFKADVSGDNAHFIQTVKNAGKDQVTEAYIMNMTAKEPKGYTVQGGQVKEDLFVPLTWAMLPLDYGLPLIYGSMGPTAKGSEAVDGRAADKFDIDTAKAPAGTQQLLQGFGLNVYSSKGTVWIDKETGALLKMAIDYERDVKDTTGGTVVGKGTGHIELTVTQVGKVKVTLPDTSKSGNAAPTQTTGQKPAAVPSATAQPSASQAKVGQKVALNGYAVTVTKAEQTTGPADAKADTGNVWIVVRVTLENVGNENLSVDPEQFEFIDKSGVLHNNLVNAPSAPSTYSDDILEYAELVPGGKLEDKIVLIQLKKTLAPGLKLRFSADDDNRAMWNLGF